MPFSLIQHQGIWKISSKHFRHFCSQVFHKLRANKFSDVLTPAKEQFGGEGSLGNGGAMRVAPIALFYHNDYDKLIKVTRLATAITHTHKLGIDGAILQVIFRVGLSKIDNHVLTLWDDDDQTSSFCCLVTQILFKRMGKERNIMNELF